MVKAKEGKERKNTKKEAVMTLKEKRAAKKARKEGKSDSSVI
jgi:hypothetical protein